MPTVNLETLSSFIKECQPKSVVRVSTQEDTQGAHGVIVRLMLHGLNDKDDIIVLEWSKIAAMRGMSGHSEILEQVSQIRPRVEAFLREQGFIVQGGCYALPASLRRLRGVIDVVLPKVGAKDG